MPKDTLPLLEEFEKFGELNVRVFGEETDEISKFEAVLWIYFQWKVFEKF